MQRISRSTSDSSRAGRLAGGRIALAVVIVLCLLEAVAARGLDPSLLERRKARFRRLGPKVTAISFVGNETFSAKELSRYMETRKSSLLGVSHLTPRTLDLDLDKLELFYATQGFLEAEVLTEDSRLSADSTKVEILIGVYEGPRWVVSDVHFSGNEALTETELRDAISVTEGSPLLSNELDVDRKALLDGYARRSYLDARVHQDVQRDDVNHTATITYRIVEREHAAIGSIEIVGLEKTRDYVITRELAFEEGQAFDFKKIGKTQANLYRTNLFSSIWIEPAKEDTGRAVKRLMLRLNERPSGTFDFRFGYGSVDGLETGTEISNRNLQGQAIRMGLDARLSRFSREVQLSVGDPWFLGLRVGLDGTASHVWRALDDRRRLIAETTGGGLTLSKRLGAATQLEGGYEYEYTSVFETGERGEIVDQDAVAETVGDNYTSDVFLGCTYDTRNSVLDASRGVLARAEVKFASSRLGGTNDFVRTGFWVRGFKKLRRRTVVAGAVRIGWIKPQGDAGEVPVNERYLAGGEGSVRGFDRNTLGPLDEHGTPMGGRALLVVRAEARFTLVRKFGVVAFADAGQVFEEARALRVSELAVAAGGGLRLGTPLGVLRFDIATPVSVSGSPRYYFGMGQAF